MKQTLRSFARLRRTQDDKVERRAMSECLE